MQKKKTITGLIIHNNNAKLHRTFSEVLLPIGFPHIIVDKVHSRLGTFFISVTPLTISPMKIQTIQTKKEEGISRTLSLQRFLQL